MARVTITLYDFCLSHTEYTRFLDEYDINKNIIPVNLAKAYNNKEKYWWYCKEHDYSWQDYPDNRMKCPTPPCCSGKRATKTNNFAVLFPELLKDWDYAKNEDDPYNILPGTHKRVYWKCHLCGHEWSTKLYSRTNQTADCPECSKAQTSKSERMVFDYIKQTFPNTTHQKGDRQGTPELDIVIPEIKVAIEYDGYPWHVTKLHSHIDKLNYCNSHGYVLINIAEYKNTPEIIQEVQSQYTPNHRVLYFDTTGNYNRDNILPLVYNYFKTNGVTLKNPTEDFIHKVKQEVRLGERKDSLWNHPDYQWLHNWITDEQSIKLAKAYTYGSADVKIKLTCPDCGRIIKKTPHNITSRFAGCIDRNKGCGCREYIPDSQIIKVKEDYYIRNQRKAEAKKRRQANKE